MSPSTAVPLNRLVMVGESVRVKVERRCRGVLAGRLPCDVSIPCGNLIARVACTSSIPCGNGDNGDGVDANNADIFTSLFLRPLERELGGSTAITSFNVDEESGRVEPRAGADADREDSSDKSLVTREGGWVMLFVVDAGIFD